MARTTRAAVIVALWMVLSGGIGDAIQGGQSPVSLLAFHVFITALAVAALWVQFKPDPPASTAGSCATRFRGRRGDPHRYD